MGSARYSQKDVIPESGILPLGSIGGDAYVATDMLGYHIPPRVGLLWVYQLSPETPQALELELSGYDNRPIVARAPGRVLCELPCDVIVRGAPGTAVQIMTWELEASGADRGAAQSLRRAGADTSATVPLWASSYDFEGETDAAVATFRDAAGAVVGIASGRFLHTNFSLPDGAASVTLSVADSLIVFRQNG